MRLLTALFVFALPAKAFACANITALLQAAYPAATLEDGVFMVEGAYAQRVTSTDVACKVWPARPELTLLAVPLIEAEPETEDQTRGDVEVIMADTRTGKPVARRLEKGMAFGDAFQFSGLTLDTARYDIRSGVRAFGVVTRQDGSSRVNPFRESALWLYEPADGTLKRVLDGLIVAGLSGENNGDCTGSVVEMTRTISLGDALSNGYRELLVKQTDVETVSTGEGGNCSSTQKPATSRQFSLRFENGRYRAVGASEDDVFSSIELGGE